MTTYRKKLIEVAIPLAAIDGASAAEKLIHVGTTSNLHAWWARRPLAACRAVIFASLVDDPSEYLPADEADAKRQKLFALMERLVAWEANNDPSVLAEARDEIRASVGDRRITIVDPFSGGGTIPVEALRLGLDTIGIDLNPVAVTISKALVEVPPAVSDHQPISPAQDGLALEAVGFEGFKRDLDYYAAHLLNRVRVAVTKLYDGTYSGSIMPVAWLWCRTAQCPNPGCGARIPLISSMWLSKSPQSRAWLKFAGREEGGRLAFDVVEDAIGEPEPAPVTDSGATCPVCRAPITFAALREQGRAGQMGFQLNAFVTKQGRVMTFHAASSEHERKALAVRPSWTPDTRLPEAALGFRVQKYGLSGHRDLFLDRQLEMLALFGDALEETLRTVKEDAAKDAEYGRSVAVYLALFFDRLVQTNNALVRWFTRVSGPSKAQPTFDKQTVQMVWDFAEANPLADSTGGWSTCCKYPVTALDCLPKRPGKGWVQHGDSSSLELPRSEGVAYVFCTDPPYFDNIGYADLSDFFYTWLRRSLRSIYPEVFRTIVVPKDDEIIADPSRHGGDRAAAFSFFYDRLGLVFQQMHKHTADFPATIFYAFKQEERDEAGASASTGWEGVLQALVDSDWTITGTWPIRTEHPNRPRGIGANALASSVVLVCRRRAPSATPITRGELRRMLRTELPGALRVLQRGNIAPVDMAQASIGPAMAIFSRYAQVLEADGSTMRVRAALQLVNEVLDEHLTAAEGEFDADSRFAITWYEEYGWDPGPFGRAEDLARARNVSVNGVVEAGICHSGAGKVRILKRPEMRPLDYDPMADERPTVWEFTQHMIRVLDDDGEEAAARLLKKLGPAAEATRELAYRLYATCEKKKWAEDARSYNGLILAWPELEKLAAKVGDEPPPAAPSKPGKKGTKAKKTAKGQARLFEGDDDE
jgi:putative DNA methylase